MTYPIIPIDQLSWYHLPYLLAAEAGNLRYNRSQYPVHGVPNNAMACYWGGLLADGHGGMRLTDEGRTRLAEWKDSPEGREWKAGCASDDESDPQEWEVSPRHELSAAPEPAQDAEVASQLTLFPENAET